MSEGNNEFDKQEFFSLFLNPEVPFNYKFLFVAAAGLYSIMPIDFIPEAIPFLGVADDVGIWIMGAQVFTHFANKKLEELHQKEQMQPDVIEGTAYNAQAVPQSQQQLYQPLDAPPPAQSEQKPAPRVIRQRERIKPQPDEPPKQPTHLPPNTSREEENDFLHDEWHEKFIVEKRKKTDDEFDQLVKKRNPQEDNDQWDFTRNDPFKKRK